MVKENRLYYPIRDALKNKIQKALDNTNLGICYLEVTSKKFSNALQQVFDDASLYFLKVEGVYPDITGYIQPKNEINYTKFPIIVVEVKDKEIKIKDVYQVKLQAEFLRARYALLLSTENINVRQRRFLLKRREVLMYNFLNPKTRKWESKTIIIAKFDEETKQFHLDNRLYDIERFMPSPFYFNPRVKF